MLDHIILTASDVERSLAFYEAALKPVKIRFFMPYKGENGHPDLWGFGDGKKACFWLKQGTPDPGSIHWGFKAESRSMIFIRQRLQPVRRTISRREPGSNTIQDITQPMYSIPTDTHSKQFTKAE